MELVVAVLRFSCSVVTFCLWQIVCIVPTRRMINFSRKSRLPAIRLPPFVTIKMPRGEMGEQIKTYNKNSKHLIAWQIFALFLHRRMANGERRTGLGPSFESSANRRWWWKTLIAKLPHLAYALLLPCLAYLLVPFHPFLMPFFPAAFLLCIIGIRRCSYNFARRRRRRRLALKVCRSLTKFPQRSPSISEGRCCVLHTYPVFYMQKS